MWLLILKKKTKKHYRWFPWNALSVSCFFVLIFLSESLRKSFPLVPREKKQVRRSVLHWESRPKIHLLQPCSWQCLMAVVQKRANVLTHLPQSAFLASVNVLFCLFKGSVQGYFHEFLSGSLKTWTDTIKTDSISQFDYVSHEGPRSYMFCKPLLASFDHP